jgi:predicted MFS family arabinose efflux permease
LREYVESGGVGRFFGLLRTGWHLTLIAYYVAAQRWLAAHPGSFAPLFAVATACGLLRIMLVARLPEAPSERGQRIRMREVLGVLLRDRRLRAYLYGVGLCGASRRVVIPFSIVLMRRVLDLTEGQVLLATVAYFCGGFVSLYLWGRVVDRYGPRPVFGSAGLLLAAVYCVLVAIAPAAEPLQMAGVFFAIAVLSSGFGVADTHVRFSVAPENAPLRHLVVSDVASSVMYGTAPLLTGLLLDAALSAGIAPVAAYRAVFAAAAGATLLSLVPLRRFGR